MRQMNHSVRIDAPAPDVFEAISTEAGIRGWWTPACDFSGVGFTVSFQEDSVAMTHRIDVADPAGGHVRFTCTDHRNNIEWLYTVLDWQLRPSRNAVELHLRHENWARDADLYESCDEGWKRFLHSIRSLVETGEGNPVGE